MNALLYHMFFKILLSLENGAHTPHTYNITEMQGPPLLEVMYFR